MPAQRCSAFLSNASSLSIEDFKLAAQFGRVAPAKTVALKLALAQMPERALERVAEELGMNAGAAATNLKRAAGLLRKDAVLA